MQEKYQKSTKLEKYLIAFALGLYLQIFLRISETYYFAAGNSKTEFESLLRQDRAVTEKSYAHTADGIGHRQRKPPFVLLESVGAVFLSGLEVCACCQRKSPQE